MYWPYNNGNQRERGGTDMHQQTYFTNYPSNNCGSMSMTSSSSKHVIIIIV